MPTTKQIFWSVAITLATMAVLKHVVPRIPVVNDLAAKVVG